MTFLDRVRAVFGLAPRSATFAANPVSIDTMFRDMQHAGHGRVTRAEALSVPAVSRGRNLICSIATIPLQTIDQDNQPTPSELLDQVDPLVPDVVTMAQTLEDLMFEGVAYWRKLAYDVYGFPVAAQRLDPGQCSVNPPKSGWQHLLPSGVDPRGYLWVEGKPVAWSEIVRFDSPNAPFLVVGADTVRLARAHIAAAQVYADDPRPMDYITPKEPGYDPDDSVLRDFFARFRRARKARGMAFIPGSFQYEQVQQPTPADLQLAELKKDGTLDVANFLGLSPEDFGVSTTTRTYANIVDKRQDRINETYAPYMDAITGRLSMNDVTWPGRRVRYDLSGYLKADPKTRAEVQLAYLAGGVVDVAEIRAEEGRPKRVMPAPQPAPIQATAGQPLAIEASGAPSATFSRVTGLSFGYEPDATFAVDTGRRTVTGLAVPYGAWATYNGRRYRFAQGSLQWADIKRVKLLRDHNNATAVGKATTLTDTDAGLVAAFSVSRGAAGDEALALAADEVLDGLSVGVDWAPEDVVADPLMPGAWLVKKAHLREVSLTAVPAFDDSRLTSVRASDQGDTMTTLTTPDGTPGTPAPTTGPPAPPTPAPAPAPPAPPANTPPPAGMFSAQQIQFMIDNGLGVQPPAAPAAPAGPPAVVVPRGTPAATVNEPAPYRFDRGGNFAPEQPHVFSADLHAMAMANDQYGDRTEAGKRVMGLLAAEFATVSTDINELNPTIDRPDMYVDQREYRTPLWNAVNKGAPPNGVNPFRFPKFNASSGLVGDHVEGVEPTAGSLTTTDQTVTPTALSGKASLTREVWDMGGNPAVSTLMFNQMKRGYREGLETAVATFLNTLTAATDIALGVAVVDEALAAAWDAAVADLQFIRGYDFEMFAIEKVLYKAFVAATATDGRKIYPILNPSNANGRSRSRFQTLDLAGVEGVPSWALASTAGAVNNSWLFDPTTVHGWATAPQRLEFPGTDASGDYAPVAMVDIAIWGYKAFANSDIGGVRQVTYDSAA